MISIPHRKTRPAAAWAEAITRKANAAVPLAAPGMLPFTTPDGASGYTPAPVNRRQRSSSASAYVDRSCFVIAYEPPHVNPATEAYHYLDRGYFMVGGLLKLFNGHVAAERLEQFLPLGDEPEPDPETGITPEYSDDDLPFIALKIRCAPAAAPTDDPLGTAHLAGYKSLGDLQTAQADPNFYLRPLYQLTRTHAVKIDFRNLPDLSLAEN